MRRLALFDKGFRPFFLLAAVASVVYLPAWLAALWGWWVPPRMWSPAAWHGHEMMFGYTAAVLAGFLLTAVSQWTGRETAEGWWLAGLASLWVAGRIAIMLGGLLPVWLIAIVDLAFIPALAVAVGRALWASGNYRNMPFVGLLLAFWAGNVWMHLTALGGVTGSITAALWSSVDVMMVIALVITGRIIPMFTDNAVDASVGSWPGVDKALVALLAAYFIVAYGVPADGLAGWADEARAVLGLSAGFAILARMAPWGWQHTLMTPILWILHVGHAWIAVGFILRGFEALGMVPAMAALHAFTAGAIGTLTIAMMTRVVRGHTGRAFRVTKPIVAAYVAVVAAGVLRVAGSVAPSWYLWSLWGSGVLWATAFAVYLAVYTPMVLMPRVDAKFQPG